MNVDEPRPGTNPGAAGRFETEQPPTCAVVGGLITWARLAGEAAGR